MSLYSSYEYTHNREKTFIIYNIGNVDRVVYDGSDGTGSGNRWNFYDGNELQFIDGGLKEAVTRYEGNVLGRVRSRHARRVLGVDKSHNFTDPDFVRGKCVDPRVVMTKILFLWCCYNVKDFEYVKKNILNPVPSFQEARQWVEKNGFAIPPYSKGGINSFPRYKNDYSRLRGVLLYPPKVPSRLMVADPRSIWTDLPSPDEMEWGDWPENWTEEHRRRWHSLCESKQ